MTCSRLSRLLLVGLAPVAALACIAAGCRPAVQTATPVPAETASVVDAWPRTYDDALGDSATLDAPPERVVSIAPAVTEILFAIGAGDRVVGVTSNCDYPPEAADLPKVGKYLNPNLERILDLQPDLVLAMRGTPKQPIEAVRRAGVPVLAYDPQTVDAVLDLMETFSHMVLDAPADVVAELRDRVDAVAEAGRALPRKPGVLCAIQLEPLYAAGPGTHIDDMIRLAGGENAAGDVDVPWPQYSLERMLEHDPEVIVTTAGHIEGRNESDAQLLARLADSDIWSGFSAVGSGRVVSMHDDLLTVPAPRMVDGLEQMAEAVRAAAEGTAEVY